MPTASGRANLNRWDRIARKCQLFSGALRMVELHWYEAHGIGKRNVKMKRYLNE